MKRDEQGRTKTERLIDEAKRERRNAIIAAFLIGAAVGALAILALLDAAALHG